MFKLEVYKLGGGCTVFTFHDSSMDELLPPVIANRSKLQQVFGLEIFNHRREELIHARVMKREHRTPPSKLVYLQTKDLLEFGTIGNFFNKEYATPRGEGFFSDTQEFYKFAQRKVLSKPLVASMKVLLEILGNHYVRSRGFTVSEPRETNPRSEIADVPTGPHRVPP